MFKMTKGALKIILITAFLLLVGFLGFSQDKKISQLPALPSVSGNEQLPLAYSGSNYYMTPSQLRTWLNIIGYAPLAGTLSSAPMTGGLEWRGNKIALYDTSGLMILFAGNKKISPTIYSAINFSNSDSLRIKSTDASGNSSLHSFIGSIQTFVSQSTSFTNTTTYSPTNTTFTKPCNYASNLSSLFTKYTHVDSLWVSGHYIAINSNAGGDLTGTYPNPTITNSITINGTTQALHGNPSFTVTSGTTYTNTAPITITSGTVIGISQSSTSADGYLSSTDWNTFNNKQPQINGTGFVKASGTTISYDNSTYLTTSSAASTYAPINNPTFTGNVTLAQDATSNLQAVTLQQLNNAILGTDYKQACKYVTVSTLPAYTYNNGSSGVGATITGVSFGAITFDGVTPSVGDRVLVALETGGNAPYNGIYTVTTVGAVATLYVLTRATDYNQSNEITSGDAVFISAGNTKAASTYVYNGITAPTVGTTNITFVQTQGQGVYSAGSGLQLISNVFSIAASSVTNSMLANSTFTINGTGMALGTSSTITAAAGTLTGTTLNSTVVNSSLTSLGTIATGVWNGTTISTPYLPANQSQLTTALNLTSVGTVTTGTWNSKIIPVVGTVTTASVITINTDNYNYYTVTSLSVATTFTVPTGTPSAGQPLTIRIKDNGTARLLTFSTGSNGFRFSSNLPAPTTTTLSKTLYATFRWNEADSFWDCQGYMDGY